MAQFEVSVTIIVEAEDDNSAYACAEAVAQNLVCGDITRVNMGSVVEITD